jgi:hypothetical protein
MQITDLPYLVQFLLALILTSLTVLIHLCGMNWVQHYFNRFWLRANRKLTKRMVMVGIMAIMMFTHCAEVAVWAIFYHLLLITPDWHSSVFYSLASYSTLGETNIILTEQWRGVGGLEGINAMLMFGWSTAVLAMVSLKLRSLDE